MWFWFLLGTAVAFGIWHDRVLSRSRVFHLSLVAAVLGYVALTKHLL